MSLLTLSIFVEIMHSSFFKPIQPKKYMRNNFTHLPGKMFRYFSHPWSTSIGDHLLIKFFSQISILVKIQGTIIKILFRFTIFRLGFYLERGGCFLNKQQYTPFQNCRDNYIASASVNIYCMHTYVLYNFKGLIRSFSSQ